MWVSVALSISVILVLLCSLPMATPSAVIPDHVKPNSMSKLVATGNVLHSGGCPSIREGDGFDG